MIEIITKALPVVITFAAAAAFIRLCYKANKKHQAGEQYWLKPMSQEQRDEHFSLAPEHTWKIQNINNDLDDLFKPSL